MTRANLVRLIHSPRVDVPQVPAGIGEFESSMGPAAQTREHAVLLRALVGLGLAIRRNTQISLLYLFSYLVIPPIRVLSFSASASTA